MKKLLLLVLLIPSYGMAQSINRQLMEIKHPELKSNLFKASRRIETGAQLLGVGGACVAGAVILSLDADIESKRTTVKIMSAAGGVLCLLGGTILGSAGERLFMSRRDRQIAFNGNSIIYKF